MGLSDFNNSGSVSLATMSILQIIGHWSSAFLDFKELLLHLKNIKGFQLKNLRNNKHFYLNFKDFEEKKVIKIV